MIITILRQMEDNGILSLNQLELSVHIQYCLVDIVAWQPFLYSKSVRGFVQWPLCSLETHCEITLTTLTHGIPEKTATCISFSLLAYFFFDHHVY